MSTEESKEPIATPPPEAAVVEAEPVADSGDGSPPGGEPNESNGQQQSVENPAAESKDPEPGKAQKTEDKPKKDKKDKKRNKEKEIEEDEKQKKKSSGKMTKADQERARQLGKAVPLGFLQKTLSDNLEARRLMGGMIFYVIFMVMFVFFFMARRDLEAEYFMANSLKEWTFGEELPPTNPLTPTQLNGLPYFEKLFSEIGNWYDWYDYVEAILVPQLFVSSPENTWTRRLTGQNIPIGSLRIRAKHVTDHSCTVNADFYPEDEQYHPRICYGEYSTTNELTVQRNITGESGSSYVWDYTDGCGGWDRWLWMSAEYNSYYSCSGYVIDIPFNTTVEDALIEIAKLRKGSYALIVSARLLSIEYITYNPAIDAFVSARLFTELTPGGGYLPQQRFRPFRVHNGNDRGWAAYYIIFAFVVTGYAIKFITGGFRHKRIHGRGWTYFLDLWNLLELINLLSFYVVFGLVFFWWNESTKIDWTFPYEISSFPLALQAVGESFFLQVYFNALNTVIVFLKIMKYLRLNNRLNILQRTMETAAQSIFGVLIVFFLVVAAYTFSGYSLFGTVIWDYRTTDEAFAALCRLLVGVFDYPAMRDSNRAMTFIFFWSFVIIGLFVLLNFVIAVIMNGFDKENSRIKTVPLHVVIQRTIRSTKQLILTPGFFGKVFSTFISSGRKMPEKELYEYISTYISTVKFTRDQLYGDSAEEDQTKVEDEPFFRHDWERVMPRSALEDIGEDYLNNIWCEVVTELENTTTDEDEEHVADVCKTIHEAVCEAATLTFLRHKKTLFGEEALRRREVGKEVEAALKGTVLKKHRLNRHRSVPVDNLEGSMMSLGGTTASDEASSQGVSESGAGMDDYEEHVLTRRAYVTSKGDSATSAGQIVDDLEERLDRIERRYACLGQLMATIEGKLA